MTATALRLCRWLNGAFDLLVQRQRLQLAGERGVDAAVRAIQAAEAVVDGPEVHLASSASEERGGGLELHQRLGVVAAAEQVVAKRMQRPGLEHRVRYGARVGDHSFVQRRLGRRIAVRDTRSNWSVETARPVDRRPLPARRWPVRRLLRFGQVAFLFGDHVSRWLTRPIP